MEPDPDAEDTEWWHDERRKQAPRLAVAASAAAKMD
jgi:hypothetical protein